MEESFEVLVAKLKLTDAKQELIEGSDEVLMEEAGKTKFCLFGKLLTTRYFNKIALADTMKKIWSPAKAVTIRGIRENLFVFQFYHELDKQRVIAGSPWSFVNNLLLLKEYDGTARPSEVVVNEAVFWIQVYDLPFNWMNEDVARRIGNEIERLLNLIPKMEKRFTERSFELESLSTATSLSGSFDSQLKLTISKYSKSSMRDFLYFVITAEYLGMDSEIVYLRDTTPSNMAAFRKLLRSLLQNRKSQELKGFKTLKAFVITTETNNHSNDQRDHDEAVEDRGFVVKFKFSTKNKQDRRIYLVTRENPATTGALPETSNHLRGFLQKVICPTSWFPEKYAGT